MERREFIKSVAVGLAAIGFFPRISRAAGDDLDALRRELTGGPDKDAPWERIRQEFLLAPGLIHLNCGSLGATPRLVLEAVSGYLRELESDPVHNLYGPMGAAMEGVRRHAATFLGANESEVTITRNTTEGMNLIATGLKLSAGDEVLTTNHEHAGGLSGWQHVAERDGVKIVQVKLPAPAPNRQAILDLLAAAITPRTRVCSVSHVETITGLQMPLQAIAAITRPQDILLVADGAQAPGMLAVNVAALGVDAYASSSHKWMLAPKGSGLLYIRRAAQDRIRPVSLRAGYAVYTGASGTRNVPHILGHGLAMDFHDAIGRDRVEARCRELQQRLRTRLENVPGLRILTPREPALSSAMLTVALTKGRSAAVADRLFKERRIVVKVVPSTLVVDPAIAPQDYNALRFSTHVFNSEAEIDATADALAEMMG
ncbi:aminotransferase class V-fold PLP-dependent enzyme [bacterium]|nr:aminotransferase class V-fold PLP-dependent enzyme [bacterium]